MRRTRRSGRRWYRPRYRRRTQLKVTSRTFKNTWNNRTYICDDEDDGSAQFSRLLHNAERDPMHTLRKVCGYCNTLFKSRNALFNHLGFMNIDVRSEYRKQLDRARMEQMETDDIVDGDSVTSSASTEEDRQGKRKRYSDYRDDILSDAMKSITLDQTIKPILHITKRSRIEDVFSNLRL